MPGSTNGPVRACAECGGDLLWDAALGLLHCQRCGAVQPARRVPQGRLGSGARQVRCHECHAEVEIPDEVHATRCDFCGSSLIVEQDAAQDHDRPEAVVPFAVDRARARRAFQAWLGRLWLRPSDLRRASALHELHGVYIPYWAFTCAITSRWSADAGYTSWAEERTPKGTRRVPRVRWRPCSGQRHDRHEDHLVCASRGLAAEQAGPAHRFDTTALLPYAPEYLLGFSAERYAVDLREAWQRARQALGRLQERRCAGDVPGDTRRGLRATHQYHDVRFKHVLLPMWIAAYRYRGRTYRFVVNGQTGRVTGKAPHSLGKIALLVALLALLAALAYALYPRPPADQPFMRSTMRVVERPSTRGTISTRPPHACTSRAPTIVSRW